MTVLLALPYSHVTDKSAVGILMLRGKKRIFLTMILTDSPCEQLHCDTDELDDVVGSLIDIGPSWSDQAKIPHSITDLVLCQLHHLNTERPTQI